jgi:hypothetical protein
LKTKAVIPPKGILNPTTSKKMFQHTRHVPSEDIGFFVHHYLIISWDLTGKEPYNQEILSHPNVNLIFEKDGKTYYKGERNTIDLTGGTVTYENWE